MDLSVGAYKVCLSAQTTKALPHGTVHEDFAMLSRPVRPSRVSEDTFELSPGINGFTESSSY